MENKGTQDLSIFLKQAIAEFYEDNSEDSLLTVMAILADCPVWVPCHLVGKEDPEAKKYIEQDGALLEPEILENGGETYYMAFSSQNEMGQYGRDLLSIQCPFLKLLAAAKEKRDELTGIVINVFHEPLALNWELLDVIETYMTPMPADFSYTIPPEDS